MLRSFKRGSMIRHLGFAVALSAGLASASAYALDQTVVRFPNEVVPVGAGRIEFLARLSGYRATDPITTGVFGGGAYPALLRFVSPSESHGILMSFTTNDGLGGGGLAGSYDGTPGLANVPDSAATGGFTQSFTYGTVLGGCVDCWHKYELRWNKDGLPGVDNNQRKVAVYLDGTLASNYFQTDSASIFPALPAGELNLGYPHSQVIPDRGIVSFDELRIFDGQGKLVLYNSLDSVDAIRNSVVGLGGTYAAGDFVAGAVGNAITQTMVPEPDTYLLILAGIGLAGGLARRRRLSVARQPQSGRGRSFGF